MDDSEGSGSLVGERGRDSGFDTQPGGRYNSYMATMTCACSQIAPRGYIRS